MDDDFEWNKKVSDYDYISICCYCPDGATYWAVIEHWDENDEMYKKYKIVKKCDMIKK